MFHGPSTSKAKRWAGRHRAGPRSLVVRRSVEGPQSHSGFITGPQCDNLCRGDTGKNNYVLQFGQERPIPVPSAVSRWVENCIMVQGGVVLVATCEVRVLGFMEGTPRTVASLGITL